MNQPIIELVNFFIGQKLAKTKDNSVSYLHTHEAISRLSRFYEALRNAVDLKEEHLIRRNAIERILKRLIIFENAGRQAMGKELLLELIRGGYLSNDALPESRVEEFEKIIGKYIQIIKGVDSASEEKQSLQNWVISVASVDIEEELNPEQLIQEKIITGIAFNELSPIVKISGVSEVESKTQLYIAILKTIIKADESLMRLRLLNAHCQGFDVLSPEAIKYLTKNIYGLSTVIEKEIQNKLNIKFSRHIKKFAPVFWLLTDFVREAVMLSSQDDQAETPLSSAAETNKGADKPRLLADIAEIQKAIFLKIENEGYLNKVVGRICDRRYFEAKMRLKKATRKSIIFLLLTKTILALVLEFPYGLYILKKVNHLSLVINIVFHPILLKIIAASIKIPGPENTNSIIRGVKELLNPDLPKEIFKPQIISRRSPLANTTLNIVYAFISLFIFFFLIIGLIKLGFNIVSIALFCFFLSLVSFLGWRSRKSIQEMFVTSQPESFLALLLDFFALPVVNIGKWLTKKLPKFNIFTIILDFLIEAPFQVIVGGLESWAKFTKEKREELEI